MILFNLPAGSLERPRTRGATAPGAGCASDGGSLGQFLEVGRGAGVRSRPVSRTERPTNAPALLGKTADGGSRHCEDAATAGVGYAEPRRIDPMIKIRLAVYPQKAQRVRRTCHHRACGSVVDLESATEIFQHSGRGRRSQTWALLRELV